jgi:hypothetical protein
LQTAVTREFGSGIKSETFPRTVVYQWLRTYVFPKPQESIRIYDVAQAKYLDSEAEYNRASDNLIAEGSESTLIFLPHKRNLVSVAKFLERKGGFFRIGEDGRLLPAPEGSAHPFELNPERISDEAYMTPMIITTYDPQLEKELPSFGQIKKLYKVKGCEEISTYVDKTFDEFVKTCRIKFETPITRLGNRLFKEFINYEEDPRLS